MMRRFIGITGISAWVVLIVIMVILAFQTEANGDPMFENLPEGWRVVQSFMVPRDQKMAIGSKLGGRIVKLNNTVLSYKGKNLQVNVLDAATESAAERIHQSILKAHNNDPLYGLRRGKRVVEFAKTDDAELVKKARVALGLDEEVPEIGMENEDDVKLGLFDDLPYGWELKDSSIATPEQTAAIARRLGGEIILLTNNIISANGKRIQVNVMECPSKEDAKKIHGYFLQSKAHPALAASKGNIVVEYVTKDINLAIKTTWELGLRGKNKRAKYRVIIYGAPIAEADYTVWQRFVSLFSKVGNDTPDPKIVSEIAELSKKFKFSDTITLRNAGEAKNRAMYKLSPAPDSNEIPAGGDIIKYTFSNLPKKLDVPWLKMAAIVTTTPEAFTASDRKADEKLLGATKFWPVDDPRIKELAKKITAGKKSPEEKVRAILEWLKPGENIKHDGPIGSRHGVKKVLKQGYGRCWDFSDCFITLCRASGIGCRQVGGWYFGVSGHIWAEVLYEGKGFEQVDPTGGGLVDCGIYHIAYMSSEDGSIPMVYLDKPAVTFLYFQN
ncbi:MAG: transglutaminase-like domain-containing protein [Planctomycetota bacterium]|jgi:hypothetical protein